MCGGDAPIPGRLLPLAEEILGHDRACQIGHCHRAPELLAYVEGRARHLLADVPWYRRRAVVRELRAEMDREIARGVDLESLIGIGAGR